MPPSAMLREAIEALYPPHSTATRRRIRRSGSSSISSPPPSQNESLHLGCTDQTPTNTTTSTRSVTPFQSLVGQRRSRFSELLLEHGERDLHFDWVVFASSSSISGNPFDNNDGGDRDDIFDSCRMKRIEGRLRLCSQSIVFEPRQISRGIIRIPFRHTTYLGGGVDTRSSGLENAIIGEGSIIYGNITNQQDATMNIRCERHFVMKANNIIGPYRCVHSPVEFLFCFLHSSSLSMISLAKQLLDIEVSSKKVASVSFSSNVIFDMPAPPIIPLPSNNIRREEIIKKIVGPMHNRPFDTAHLLHAREQYLTPGVRCSMKTPLLDHDGCALLTDFGLYFQPLAGIGLGENESDNDSPIHSHVGCSGKVLVWSLDDMRAIARRYDGMKDTALEIYLLKRHSILLAFESSLVRERIVHILSQKILEVKSVPLPCYTDRSFVESALELWQADEIDNFEYLLCLNSAAGRSFHDLSRYPIFPWVLTNYESSDEDENGDDTIHEIRQTLDLEDPTVFRDLSKPIGALNAERFQYFKKRYDSMVQQQSNQMSQHHSQDAPFLYGTHYSAPGYVLYYLLRVMPEHMLCLQNGKFDVPDRLFHSIDSSYKSVLTNPADLKELIPEFYDPDCSDFLINSTGLQLGNLQTGQRVNDVLLPPWAKSAKSFLRQNRSALECVYCTKRLPEWIDLIFGCTSRGSGAKDASNLFHPMAYIGPEDIDAISGAEGRASASLQATEFGIVPDQLFSRKHPGKADNIGVWGDSDVLLTRDRLRESYGNIEISLSANFGRLTFNNDDARQSNNLLTPASETNPFA